MSEHEVVYGCLYELEDGSTCHCGNEPTSIANDKLAALTAAGNAMAERLRAINEYVAASATEDASVKLYAPNNAAALAAWESVTK